MASAILGVGRRRSQGGSATVELHSETPAAFRRAGRVLVHARRSCSDPGSRAERTAATGRGARDVLDDGTRSKGVGAADTAHSSTVHRRNRERTASTSKRLRSGSLRAEPHQTCSSASAIAAQVEIGAACTRCPDSCADPWTPCSISTSAACASPWDGQPSSHAYRVACRASVATARRTPGSTAHSRTRSKRGATVEIGRTALDQARILSDAGADGSESARAARAAYDTDLDRAEESRRSKSSTRSRSADATHSARAVTTADADRARHRPRGLDTAERRTRRRHYLDLLRRHDELIRCALRQHDGVEFKHTGDGIGAWFFSVTSALRCAVELMEDFATIARERAAAGSDRTRGR